MAMIGKDGGRSARVAMQGLHLQEKSGTIASMIFLMARESERGVGYRFMGKS
jgi:hypothetical protein